MNNENIISKRIDCWEDTKKRATAFNTVPSIKYIFDKNVHMIAKYANTQMIVHNIDTIDCAIRMIANGLYPLVLNLADDIRPGGVVYMGSGAQEESLFRRSNYFQTLISDFYPIKDDETIYSPRVNIFKESEKNNWDVMENSITVDFVACPGIKYPEVMNGLLCENDIKRLVKKIETIIQTAYLTNHDSLILGALGCGAWKCPSKHVANIFKDTLKKYDGVFKVICFAIIDETNGFVVTKYPYTDSNYQIFKAIIE